ncbi:TetR/AcrR family transcriptional regulator [Micromonospora sp. S4605]|uniref:TetR/AcrR family transcriptional regulator n=1 Tax=Micromonospora sp. S4605 TaxID=1420897 RepID=UPI000D6ED395|nr:TetR/AcrR family transcriptional regulator C-terminal domain-containing protein [Micromonospora sp. S4605]PWU55219.1 TetR/AcrR family transcriptional regulator [Micromonospora sp. S4605]
MSDAAPNSGHSQRESIWRRPERGTRGPAPAHNRDDIVAAAIAIADADGLAAVSMRAVATRLETGAASLYRYLSSRDDLLDLMADRVAAELRPYPEPDGDWLDAMLRMARAQRAVHERHPWLSDLSQRASAIGPEALAFFDACLRIMAPVPATPVAKFEAIGVMNGISILFARKRTAGEALTFAGLDVTPYPHLVAALTQPPIAPPATDLFERAQRSLLCGLLAPDPA